MKSIVFGGSGFLGSYVAEYLSDLGHETTIFDINPSPYLRPDQKMILGDILDEKLVREAIKGQDYVYDFAGIADLDDATTRPLDTVMQNIVGTTILLEAMRETPVKRFIYASTVYVYSEKGGFYRCSKQATELFVEEYQRKYGIDYTILRYGTLYGVRSDVRNSVYRYIKQALEEQRIIINGTGEEIREYIHVCDAAKLSCDVLNDDFKNKHVIITGHNPMRFRDMLEMIKEILGNKIQIEYLGKRDEFHYNITPYSFIPKIGNKLVSNCYMDMGQGILECIHDIYSRVEKL